VREREKKKKKKSTLDAAAFPVKGEKEIDLEGLKKKGGLYTAHTAKRNGR